MHDLIIVGAGPAGLSAGIYGSRYGLDTLVLEKNEINSQIALVDRIENYPGFVSISGMELIKKFGDHAKTLGIDMNYSKVGNIIIDDDIKIVQTENEELEAKSVIIASGAKPQKLNVPGEIEFTGKGVSYCATCDGPFFKKRDVAVIGGGNSAIAEALVMSGIADNVYVVHRRNELRAETILQNRAFATENIKFVCDSVVEEIKGSNKVEKIVVRNIITEKVEEIPVSGVFIYVGINPNTGFIDVAKTQEGFIVTDNDMKSSVEGIYAAGDCRTTPLRQVVTAVSDGAIAAYYANNYVKGI